MTSDVIELSLGTDTCAARRSPAMRALSMIVFLIGLAACGGDKPNNVDAAPDTPAGPKCTGNAYDLCNPTSSNCMTGTTCHFYMASGFSVCSPACSGTMPCPNQGSTPVSCNMMGLCKPAAANTNCSMP